MVTEVQKTSETGVWLKKDVEGSRYSACIGYVDGAVDNLFISVDGRTLTLGNKDIIPFFEIINAIRNELGGHKRDVTFSNRRLAQESSEDFNEYRD